MGRRPKREALRILGDTEIKRIVQKKLYMRVDLGIGKVAFGPI